MWKFTEEEIEDAAKLVEKGKSTGVAFPKGYEAMFAEQKGYSPRQTRELLEELRRRGKI